MASCTKYENAGRIRLGNLQGKVSNWATSSTTTAERIPRKSVACEKSRGPFGAEENIKRIEKNDNRKRDDRKERRNVEMVHPDAETSFCWVLGFLSPSSKPKVLEKFLQGVASGILFWPICYSLLERSSLKSRNYPELSGGGQVQLRRSMTRR